MKQLLVSLSLLILIPILGIILWDVTANSSKFLSAHIYPFFIKNKLIVDYDVLNPNDFEIYLSISSATCYVPVYKKGVYYDIPNEYGENDWIITYKRQQQCKFRHFKTNRRYTHKYKFNVYKKQDSLYCDIDIRGKNKMKHTFHQGKHI